MDNDILSLISLMRFEITSCSDKINATLDRVSGPIEQGIDANEGSNKILLGAIKDQLSLSLAEVERFCDSASSQLDIAEAYTKSLS